MKKLKNILLGCLAAGMLCGSTSSLWASSSPKLNVITKELSSQDISLTIDLYQVTQPIKAIEIGLVTDDLTTIKSLNWDSNLNHGYSFTKTIDTGSTTKQLTFYIIAPNDQLLAQEGDILSIGDFTFQANIQNKMDFNSDATYIKLIDDNNQSSIYKKGFLNHTHSPLSNTSDSDDSSTNNPNKVPKPEIPLIQFTDIKDHWASIEIEKMATLGIIKGYDNGSFEPNNNITRAEFATVVSRAFNFEPTSHTSPFTDVVSEKWYTNAVISLYEQGILTGRPDGSFGTHDFITTEEMAVILDRALNTLNITLNTERIYTNFLDEATISPFAIDSIQTLYKAGLINGTPSGHLHPKVAATRAQVAVMMSRILSNIEK